MENAVYTHGYRNGGPKSYELFRVSWVAFGDASELDFRTREARRLRELGLAGVEYRKGAFARDCAEERARRAVLQARKTLAAVGGAS